MTRALERDGYRAAALHGDKSQDERLKALDAFKQGEVDLLVCTDVAARGLDIKDVPAVFNYDVPFNAEDYVHRIGRTGRAGASGLAVTLVTDRDNRQVADIEKLIKKKIEPETLAIETARAGRGRREDDRWQEGRRDDRAAGHAHRPTRMGPRVSHDPFFDRPYVPQAAHEPPAWEKAAAPAVAARGHNPNIKPRRKLAALFKAPVPLQS